MLLPKLHYFGSPCDRDAPVAQELADTRKVATFGDGKVFYDGSVANKSSYLQAIIPGLLDFD